MNEILTLRRKMNDKKKNTLFTNVYFVSESTSRVIRMMSQILTSIVNLKKKIIVIKGLSPSMSKKSYILTNHSTRIECEYLHEEALFHENDKDNTIKSRAEKIVYLSHKITKREIEIREKYDEICAIEHVIFLENYDTEQKRKNVVQNIQNYFETLKKNAQSRFQQKMIQ